MSKLKIKIAVCLTILIVSLLFSSTTFASDKYAPLLDDEVVFFDTYTLESGETLNGNLVIFGGVVSLKEGSTVDGDVVVFGGNVTLDGEIDGSLVAIGGVVSLTETAVVHQDLIAPATVVRRDPNAKILGDIITENVPNVDIEIPDIVEPDIPDIPEIEPPTFGERLSFAMRPVIIFFGALVRALLFSAVSVLALLVLPDHSKRVRDAIEEVPVLSGGFGLLSVAVFFAAVVTLALLSVTVILIPVTIPLIILLTLALTLGLLFGLIVAGAEIGRRIMIAFKQNWSPTLQVAIGSFSMSFLLGLLSLGFLSFFGSLLWIVVGAMGLGSVLLTRFGTRVYVPKSSSTVTPVETEFIDDAELDESNAEMEVVKPEKQTEDDGDSEK